MRRNNKQVTTYFILFSLANSKAQLTYPVGLKTYYEAALINNNEFNKIGLDFWFLTPAIFSNDHVSVFFNNSAGFGGSTTNPSSSKQ